MSIKEKSCRKCGVIFDNLENKEKFPYEKEFNPNGEPIGQLYVCHQCHELGLENEKNTGKFESRSYSITASKEQLDSIECLLTDIQSLGHIGSSRKISIYIDGDGQFRPEFKRIDKDVEMSRHLNGYGVYIQTPNDTVDGSSYIDLG